MTVTLNISVTDDVRPAFSDAEHVVVRNAHDGAPRRALLWWAWSTGATWISARPRIAQDDLLSLLEMYPRLRKGDVQFKAPRELGWDSPRCVVVEQSGDLDDDVMTWIEARGVERVRVLEPCLELTRSNPCLRAGMTVSDLREFKARSLDGERLDYTYDDVVDALTLLDFYEFVLEYWSIVVAEKYVDNWHIPFLAGELQTVAERVFKQLEKLYDLIINIAPGSTKSLLVSVFFPAWVWKRMPSARYIGASYAQPIAMDLSRKTKDVVLSRKYQRGTPMKLREDQHAKTFFMNDYGGMRLAVGQGGVAGFHGHIIGIDDPLDPNKYSSDAEVKACNAWIHANLEQRKVDQDVTPMVTVMQRVVKGDPTDDRLERGGRVRHICLPAEDKPWVQPVELRAKYVDGLMDPHRLPEKVLAEKRQLGDFIYAGQYLQRPTPVGGIKFLVDKFVLATLPEGTSLRQWMKSANRWIKLVRYWDKAASKDKNCYTVGVLMGEDTNHRFWVLDVVRGRWDPGAREARHRQTAELDGHAVVVALELEGGSGGIDSAEMTTKNLRGYTVLTDRPDKDKVLRADPFASQVSIGNVSVINADWTREYLNELEFFPNSTYKDQVDASSGAFKILNKKKREVKGFLRSRRDEHAG